MKEKGIKRGFMDNHEEIMREAKEQGTDVPKC